MKALRRLRLQLLAACVAAITLGSAAHAQRNLREAPVPDVTRELAQFQVAEGMQVNLFASEPLIHKPIHMHFDARGRLWVVSSSLYPHIKPGDAPNDKIYVLEDADGDGTAETSTVFASNLWMPTGIVPDDNGGVYVAGGTDLLYLADHDEDGRADEKRVVFSGFGIEDTHHIIHTFRFGPGGSLYFNQSIYIHSHIETPYGVRRLGGGGIWQLRPDTQELEVFVYGMCNGWGHDYDRWGQSFGADGAYGDGVIYFMPRARYAGSPSSQRLLHGLNPGSPKYCGAEILSGRHLPEDWRGSFVTNDFRAHRVVRYVISEDGAGYAAKEVEEPLRSSDVAFRPVDIKIGPDGAIYIADWYNPIIQHGEVDFRSPMRNHTNGRIWRLSKRDGPPLKRPNLRGASTRELLEYLTVPERWTRHHAKRVLAHRDRDEAGAALDDWLTSLPSTDPDDGHHRLEALWAYQTIASPRPGLLRSLLEHEDPRIRAAATRVLGDWHETLDDTLTQLEKRVQDTHPRVRMEAVRVLGLLDHPRAMELAVGALQKPVDLFLDYALHRTANELAPRWLTALDENRLALGNTSALAFALAAVPSERCVPHALKLLKDGDLAPAQAEQLRRVAALQGGPDALVPVFEEVLARPSTALLDVLQRAARQRNILPNADLSEIAVLLDHADSTIRGGASSLVGLWKLEAQRPRLEALAKTSDSRGDAFTALAGLGGEASWTFLERQAKSAPAAANRLLATQALVTQDATRAAPLAATLLAAGGSDLDARGLVASFLARKGGANALATAISDRELTADVGKVALRALPAGRDDLTPLREAFARAAGLSNTKSEFSAVELRELEASISQGNPAHGEEIYRRNELACLGCHAIGGSGGTVGPDMMSLGTTAQLDYLIASLIEPNKAVKENYHAESVVTRDGGVLTGIRVREGPDAIVFRNTDDQEVVLRREAIIDIKQAGSLMPAGLPDTLTATELRDLLSFLASLGKPGAYSVGKIPTARTWRVLGGRRSLPVPAYSRVSGVLPLEGLPRARNDIAIVLSTEALVTTPGDVLLTLNSTDGLTVKLDGALLDFEKQTKLDLSEGLHTLTLRVDPIVRKEGILCQLVDVPGSPAVVRFVGGK